MSILYLYMHIPYKIAKIHPDRAESADSHPDQAGISNPDPIINSICKIRKNRAELGSDCEPPDPDADP